jgi:hypothetical protein
MIRVGGPTVCTLRRRRIRETEHEDQPDERLGAGGQKAGQSDKCQPAVEESESRDRLCC